MSITKHGVGEIIAEEDDSQKLAKKNFTEVDQKELVEENIQADSEK